MNRPEILAPAGNFESLTAAVFCGADAVYLGTRQLNARRNAGNFDDDELVRAVEFCRIRGVKVYQTLNILLFESETDELLRAAETAARLGIDGVMVQDLGVLTLLRRCVPELKLFASTQMAVHNLAGAREAERLGCRRIVLARELSSAEIGHIARNITAEVEVFVHGALCMSVSGQCYLSSMLGGRSGNRGLCAQPCRLPFSNGQNSHALSLKDLSLVERVSELRALGVASLKIEGRMKRPEYVAAAVTALRQALDGAPFELDTLRSVFSRSGFTSGYFDGARGRGMFGIRQKEDVVAAKDVLGQLARLAGREIPRVALTAAFSARPGEPARLTVLDESGRSGQAESGVLERAHTRAADEALVRGSLNKTGGTPYFFSAIDIDLEGEPAVAVSQLNALRREALERLSQQRAATSPLAFHPLPAKIRAKTPAANARAERPALRARCRASQLSDELLGRCDAFILPVGDIPGALAAGVGPERIIAEIPRILFCGEEKLSEQLRGLRAAGLKTAWAGNLGGLALARNAQLQACGGWSLNLTNRHAIQVLLESGAVDAELSFELSLARAGALATAYPCGIVAYGALALMAFRNCPAKTDSGCQKRGDDCLLTDRKGVSFPVRCENGVSELYNSVPLYLADRLGELSGFSFLTLWFTRESAGDCARIAAAYRGDENGAMPDAFTRGLYYRPVL